MALLKISVIVPAFNEEKLITASLRQVRSALGSFCDRDWPSELIVCDNNSSDRTAELARAEGASVVFEPINQIARARNRGADASTGEWLIFVDADSHPPRELFDAVAERISSGKYLGGGCTVRLDEFHLALEFFVASWNAISLLTGWAAGSFIFCKAQAFRELGGFSQELYVSEEIDFSRRLGQLARACGKSTTIIRRPSILTSARKARLYSKREYLRFFWELAKQPAQTLKSRRACDPWYDGRR